MQVTQLGLSWQFAGASGKDARRHEAIALLEGAEPSCTQTDQQPVFLMSELDKYKPKPESKSKTINRKQKIQEQDHKYCQPVQAFW